MKVTLKNDLCELTVSSRGAEMVCLKNLKTNRPVLWDGDKTIWEWNAPLCFPFCGRAKDGFFMIDGKRFEFAAGHGFAREYEHRLLYADEKSVEWLFEPDAEAQKRFPYRYSFKTRYELTAAGVIFTVTVTNTDTKPVYFSFGSHTALWTALTETEKVSDYCIEFERDEDFTFLQSSGDSYAAVPVTPQVYPAFARAVNKRSIPLCDEGFGSGLILTGLQSSWAGLRNTKTGELVKVVCQGFENVVLWQNPKGRPQFVCIEPWNGITDPAEANHLFEKKPCIRCLDTGRSVTYDQSILLA